jgi:hypothetical protein
MRFHSLWQHIRSATRASPDWLQLIAEDVPVVRIFVSASFESPSDHIELSSGTRIATNQETGASVNGFSYEDGARLPREPWRVPLAVELKQFLAQQVPPNMGRCVGIVKLRAGLTHEHLEAIISDDEDAIRAVLIEPLRQVCELGEPLSWHGVSTNRPGLTTVTVNRQMGHYNGLHVDTWEDEELGERDRAANRVCINVGQNDRYFLFVPFSLIDMTKILARELGPNWNPPDRYTLIGRQFMQRHPHVPVVRIRLAPGEAYIAPTENLVHDGSTVGQRSEDASVTIRGRIRPLS